MPVSIIKKETCRTASYLGFNLIEASLVLGIVGLVVGGVFAAWSAVDAQNKIRRGTEQATVIVQQVRALYGTRAALDSATGAAFTNALMDAEVLPKAWLNDSNQLKNPWGGNVLITPDQFTSGVNDGMNISFNNIPKTACFNFANNILSAARTQGLYKIDSAAVNTTTNFAGIRAGICASSTVNVYFNLKNN